MRLEIENFKCFKKATFLLKDITVLAGGNGAGKSTVIQAILLYKLALERQKVNNGQVNIPLNGPFSLNLGDFDEIVREDVRSNSIKIGFDGHNIEFQINERNRTVLLADLALENKKLPNVFKQPEFYYLHTERMGPKNISERKFSEFVHVGHHGELTAQVLQDLGGSSSTSTAALSPKISEIKIRLSIDEELQQVCPGTKATTEYLSNLYDQIKISGGAKKSAASAYNIGYGISYVLPIIVNGHVAKKGTMFIVENPESHLHPKGQTMIGYFLGKLAGAGVKVVVETHSEHVINGIRIAALTKESRLKTEDVSIYFFSSFQLSESKFQEISLDESGSLSDYPLDFFDQVNQDIAQIFKLSLNQ